MDLLEEFSYKYQWHSEEPNQNIHYYNGWASNSAWKINKRIVIRLSAYSSRSGRFEPCHYEVTDKFIDIEKVLNYLDCGGPITLIWKRL